MTIYFFKPFKRIGISTLVEVVLAYFSESTVLSGAGRVVFHKVFHQRISTYLVEMYGAIGYIIRTIRLNFVALIALFNFIKKHLCRLELFFFIKLNCFIEVCILICIDS